VSSFSGFRGHAKREEVRREVQAAARFPALIPWRDSPIEPPIPGSILVENRTFLLPPLPTRDDWAFVGEFCVLAKGGARCQTYHHINNVKWTECLRSAPSRGG
jgi:hypothetical protein